MAIQVVRKNSHYPNWASTWNSTVSVGQVERGDLIVILQMVSGTRMAIPSGYQKAGDKNLYSGLALFYKIATASGTESFYSYGDGVLMSAVLRSTSGQIKVLASNMYNSLLYSSWFAGYQDVTIIATSGNSGGNQFTSKGWEKIAAPSTWPTTDYYAAMMKTFVGTPTDMPTGYTVWSYDSYIILQETAAIDRYISYSDDGVNFSEYELFLSNDIPQKRFLKFKAIMAARNSETKSIVHQFDTSDPQSTIELNEFLERVGTDIKPITIYNQTIDEKVNHESGLGFILSKEVDKSIYKEIAKLKLKE